MYSFFIASDISKEVIDVAYHDDNQAVYLNQFTNDNDGFKQLLKQLRKITKHPLSSWFFCFENTGAYSKPLLEWLFSQGIPCREENALKISKSLGLRRGKNDKIDAKDICLYAFEKRDSINPSILPKPLIKKLKTLLSQRELLIKHKVAVDVSLKEQKKILDPDLLKMLEDGNNAIIDRYIKQIDKIGQLIEELISEDQQAKLNHELAQSVIGVGPIISAYILTYTHNYTCFSDARKFACYSGIAPFSNSSGKRKGKNKVSPMANKKIKSLLSNGANAAIQHDSQLNVYYNRKIKEGKEYGVVINAVKNKLIQRVFCTINRQSAFVKLKAYA